MSAVQNKTNRGSRLRKTIAGILKYFPNLTVTLAGVSYTSNDLIKLFQSDIDTSTVSANAKAAWLADVQLERDSHRKVDPVFRHFRSWVITQLGDTQDAAQKLDDFGFAPRKTRKKTAEKKAAAAVKAKATRTARHTMGSLQRKSVTSAVQVTLAATPMTEVPVTTSAAPSSSPPTGATPGGSTSTAASPGGSTPGGGAGPGHA
jgi:hypothetical protein